MPLTTDPTDPRLEYGSGDNEPRPQADTYLVLPEAERARGFVRPLRHSYKHVGPPGPTYPLRDLTDDEKGRYEDYVKFEPYPNGITLGRFWTQAELDSIGTGCQTITSMGQALAETYAREPKFYGATYCVTCQKHRPVDEFVWTVDETRVGS